MMAVAWVLSVIAAALGGYHYRQLNDFVHKAGETVHNLVAKQEAEEEAEPVIFLDPDDLAFQTRVAAEEARKELNRTVHDDSQELSE